MGYISTGIFYIASTVVCVSDTMDGDVPSQYIVKLGLVATLVIALAVIAISGATLTFFGVGSTSLLLLILHLNL